MKVKTRTKKLSRKIWSEQTTWDTKRIILKCILDGLHSSCSGYEPVADSCDHGNKCLCSIRSRSGVRLSASQEGEINCKHQFWRTTFLTLCFGAQELRLGLGHGGSISRRAALDTRAGEPQVARTRRHTARLKGLNLIECEMRVTLDDTAARRLPHLNNAQDTGCEARPTMACKHASKCALHTVLKMVSARFSETLVSISKSTRRYIPQDQYRYLPSTLKYNCDL